jgi:tetratricopeptide (TPR) repeat protein
MTIPNLDQTAPTPIKKSPGTEPVASVTANNAISNPSGDPLEETRPTALNGSSNPATQASADVPPPEDGQPAAPEAAAPSWKLLALVGIVTLLIIGFMAAYGGYRSGLNQRNSAQSTQVAQQVKEQFDLGVQDLQARNLDLARQRFEWVIQKSPNYPGITEMLAQVELLQNITASPTIAPTPTLTPTPDLRSVEELYTQAQQSMAGGDWSTAIDTLLKLRKEAPTLHAVEVDGMLYMALRNRGVDKIRSSDLEGGTYDLALAERFGPLDVEASNWRQWAELYITGASFWDVDWTQVIYYFQQVAAMVPNLMDASGWTSVMRLTTAYSKYGDQLAANGDWCNAAQQYQLALDLGPNPSLKPTVSYANDKCRIRNEKLTPHPSATPTTAPAGETATPTQPAPAGGPTETVTPQPPTSEPPTSEPPTSAPPTSEPTTAVPPTSAPPTNTATTAPPPAHTPTATQQGGSQQ